MQTYNYKRERERTTESSRNVWQSRVPWRAKCCSEIEVPVDRLICWIFLSQLYTTVEAWWHFTSDLCVHKRIRARTGPFRYGNWSLYGDDSRIATSVTAKGSAILLSEVALFAQKCLFYLPLCYSNLSHSISQHVNNIWILSNFFFALLQWLAATVTPIDQLWAITTFRALLEGSWQ